MNNLQIEGFISAHSLRLQPVLVGSLWQSRAAAYIMLAKKQKEMPVLIGFLLSSCFILTGSPPMRWCCPHWGQVFPEHTHTLVNPVQKCPQTHLEVCFTNLLGRLSPIKLAIKIGHKIKVWGMCFPVWDQAISHTYISNSNDPQGTE
jgi:hypothetical protein